MTAWNSTLPQRRKPMARTVTLQRTGPWAVSVPPMAPTSLRRTAVAGSSSGKLTPPAPAEFTPKVKLLVRKRAGRGDIFDAECEACGSWLGEKGGEFQHRDARGMGGSRDLVTNSAANAALLCGCAALGTGCHGLCTASDKDMLGMGFWLENGQDPRTTPIMLHGAGGGGLTPFLAEDGLGPDGTGYLLQAPAVSAS